MTVAELIEKLEDYGDHLPVKLVIRGKLAGDDIYSDISVGDERVNQEISVVIEKDPEG